MKNERPGRRAPPRSVLISVFDFLYLLRPQASSGHGATVGTQGPALKSEPSPRGSRWECQGAARDEVGLPGVESEDAVREGWQWVTVSRLRFLDVNGADPWADFIDERVRGWAAGVLAAPRHTASGGGWTAPGHLGRLSPWPGLWPCRGVMPPPWWPSGGGAAVACLDATLGMPWLGLWGCGDWGQGSGSWCNLIPDSEAGFRAERPSFASGH